MMGSINIVPFLSGIGKFLFVGIKVLLWAGGVAFIVMWKIIGYFLNIATGMAGYMAFGGKKWDRW
jgi:hypothetical protein